MPALLLVLACALWGLSFPLIKALDLEQSERLPEVSKVFLAVWLQMARFGLAVLMMLPFFFRSLPRRGEIVQGAWLALWGGLGMAIQTWGLAYTEASTSAFLTQAYCIFLPLIACLRARRLPTCKTTFATFLVLIGGAILSGMEPGNLRIGKGEAATLAAAFIFTFQILTLENPKFEGNRGLVVTFMMSVFITMISLAGCLLMAPDPSLVIRAGASVPSFFILLALALFCSVAGYGLMNSWQPKVPATEAGLIYTTEPMFTAAFALFLPVVLGNFVGQSYPNELLRLPLIVGGSLIISANILVQWRRPPKTLLLT